MNETVTDTHKVSRWKEIREKKKKEKRLKREEEIRKDRVAPKDSKIKLIDSELLEKILTPTKNVDKLTNRRVDVESTVSFPGLGPSGRPTGRHRRHDKNTFVSKFRDVALNDDKTFPRLCQQENGEYSRRNMSAVSPKPDAPNNQQLRAPVSEALKFSSDAPISKKRPSKKPISVPLSSVIVKEKQKKRKVLASKVRRETNMLSGNMLDADRPTRMKGKIKLGKKKKRFGRLKTIIIMERVVRKFARGEVYKWLTDKSYDVEELRNDDRLKQELNEWLTNLNEAHESKRFKFCTIQDEVLFDCLKDKLQQLVTLVNQDGNIIKQKSSVRFNKKFREYCDNFITAELDNAVKHLMELLVKFQDRLYAKDNVTVSAMKKRYLVGFNETRKHLKLKKVKLIIIAPDLDYSWTPGSIDDIITQIKTECQDQNLMCLFALNRKRLQYITKKKVPINIVGVLNYDGAQDQFQDVIRLGRELKNKFSEETKIVVEDCVGCELDEVKTEIISSFLTKLSLDERPGSGAGTVDTDEDDDDDGGNLFLQAIEKCNRV